VRFIQEKNLSVHSLSKVFSMTWPSERTFKNSYRGETRQRNQRSLLHTLIIWKHILEAIQGRTHLVVPFVQSYLHDLTFWKHIQKVVQGRNHSVVHCVRNPLEIYQGSVFTQELIRGKVFSCSHCSWSFTTSSSFKTQLKVHTETIQLYIMQEDFRHAST
jgi:hypothetical protein